MYYVFNHTITLLSIPYTEKKGINKTSSILQIYTKKQFSRSNGAFLTKKALFFWHLANTGGPAPLFSAHGAVRRKKSLNVCASFFFNIGGFYLFVFESACLQHAVMYLLDIPHTISAGILKVCPSGAIYRSSHE